MYGRYEKHFPEGYLFWSADRKINGFLSAPDNGQLLVRFKKCDKCYKLIVRYNESKIFIFTFGMR